MRSGQITYFTPDRPDLFGSTSIQTYPFVQNHPAHRFFFHIVVITSHQHGFFDLLFFRQRSQVFGPYIVQQFATQVFVCITLPCHIIGFLVTLVPNILTQFLIVHFVTIRPFFFSDSSSQFLLSYTLFFNSCMCKLDGVQHFFFRNFVHLAFYHHNIFIGSSDHDIQIGLFQSGSRRIDHKFSLDTGNPYLGDRTMERDIADSQSCRCSESGQCIRHRFFIGRIQGHLYKSLCMIIVREQRTQCPVD